MPSRMRLYVWREGRRKEGQITEGEACLGAKAWQQEARSCRSCSNKFCFVPHIYRIAYSKIVC